MKLSEVIGKLKPIIPSGPFVGKILDEIIKCQADVNTTLKDAEKKYAEACDTTDHALSDWDFWANSGTETFWKTMVNLLRAAKKTGLDNLPDIAFPYVQNRVVMDAQFYLSEWSKSVVKAAGAEPVKRPAFKKKKGCKCVSCTLNK